MVRRGRILFSSMLTGAVRRGRVRGVLCNYDGRNKQRTYLTASAACREGMRNAVGCIMRVLLGTVPWIRPRQWRSPGEEVLGREDRAQRLVEDGGRVH